MTDGLEVYFKSLFLLKEMISLITRLVIIFARDTLVKKPNGRNSTMDSTCLL